MGHFVYVVGARPNFVKMAPVIRAMEAIGCGEQYVVHTGQHYDQRLSQDIMEDLDFPRPDAFLNVGSGSHGEQTGQTLVAVEAVLRRLAPSVVVVAGDVNATLAAALAAAKLRIPVAHIEAGLRSFDWSMPEEINRVLTDRLSTLLFTHSPEAEQNLLAEGIPGDRIFYVGNTMVDSLYDVRRTAQQRRLWESYGVSKGDYVLVTLHRPSNVDDTDRLLAILEALGTLSTETPVVFPVHPRTRERVSDVVDTRRLPGRLMLVEPVGYVDFVSLEVGARAVITDSGGVQEETSALGVECYTLRPNTERPITVSNGSNTILGTDPAAIEQIQLRRNAHRRPTSIPLWDGHASDRVAEVLARTVVAEAAGAVLV